MEPVVRSHPVAHFSFGVRCVLEVIGARINVCQGYYRICGVAATQQILNLAAKPISLTDPAIRRKHI
jgi:hypothetical protein